MHNMCPLEKLVTKQATILVSKKTHQSNLINQNHLVPCPPALQAYLLNSSDHGLLMVHLLRNLLVVCVALGANVSLAKSIDDIAVRRHKVDAEGIRPGDNEERQGDDHADAAAVALCSHKG